MTIWGNKNKVIIMRLITISALVTILIHWYTKGLANEKINCSDTVLISLKQGPEKS